MPVLTTYATFAAAAVAEIAGCFAFWAWLRNGQSVWWLVPGMASLVVFAWLLTLVPSDHAGAPTPPMAASTSQPRSSGYGLPKVRSRTFGIWPAAVWH